MFELEASVLNTQQSENVVRHIEVKAYLDSYQSICERLAALAEMKPTDRVQHDIFFHCRSGRLKLRSSGQFHDLIYYRRNDDYGPTESFYQSARTENPAALRTSLNSAFGEAGRVKKFRRTYTVGQSVIHVDRVAGLGDFLEIKAQINTPQKQSNSLTPEQGAAVVEQLMTTLDVDLFQLIDGAYIDLINERNSSQNND